MSKEFINLRKRLKGKLVSKEGATAEYLKMSETYRFHVEHDVFVDYFTNSDLSTTLWFDYETWGKNPIEDQASQKAALRLDQNFNLVDIPFDMYCKPSVHRLAHPIAVQITNISPLKCMNEGVCEYEFFSAIRDELMVDKTCSNAYNGINFDRTVTRFGFYRNLLPAYEHESSQGNSVWDILMVGAMARAVKPEGINWPLNEEGRPSLRLEHLASANGIEQINAHNAVDDCRALADWAKLLKSKQPKLWDFLWEHKHKKKLKEYIKPLRHILVHTNMAFGIETKYTRPILPLFFCPTAPDSVIAIDLSADYEWIKQVNPAELKELLYMKKAALEDAGKTRPPIIKIKLTTCPAIAPIGVVDDATADILGFDKSKCAKKAKKIVGDKELLKLIFNLYTDSPDLPKPSNVEHQLYSGGFFSRSDNAKIKAMHENGIKYALNNMTEYDDPRVIPLLKRIIAKNYPDYLSEDDLNAWHKWCIESINTESDDDEVTFMNYKELAETHISDANLKNEYLIYVQNIKDQIGYKPA